MLGEGLLHGYVAHHIASGVVVQQAIEADALDRGHETSRRCEGLQAAAGADAYHGECAMLVFLHAGLVVDIGQRVEFVDHNVDVVAANAVTLTGDALAFIGAGDGVELATAHFVLDGVEMGGNGAHAGWVANENDLIGQMFGFQMKMKARSVFVDDEFGGCKCFLFVCHSLIRIC